MPINRQPANVILVINPGSSDARSVASACVTIAQRSSTEAAPTPPVDVAEAARTALRAELPRPRQSHSLRQCTKAAIGVSALGNILGGMGMSLYGATNLLTGEAQEIERAKVFMGVGGSMIFGGLATGVALAISNSPSGMPTPERQRAGPAGPLPDIEIVIIPQTPAALSAHASFVDDSNTTTSAPRTA
ncbi:MAG: hypothetical protein V4695_08590 [Pseudomonadota bacterium]